jgi:hypothetical protein
MRLETKKEQSLNWKSSAMHLFIFDKFLRLICKIIEKKVE